MFNSATLTTITRQAPLSIGFSRQEHWNGLSWPPSGDLPSPGIKSASLPSPALASALFTTEPPGNPTEQTVCSIIVWLWIWVSENHRINILHLYSDLWGYRKCVVFVTLVPSIAWKVVGPPIFCASQRKWHLISGSYRGREGKVLEVQVGEDDRDECKKW